jgi:PAS domain-containing protein
MRPGRITYINQAAGEIFGLDESAIGKRLDERVRGLDWQALSNSSGALSRDLEIFYPANRFINFYIVPLLIERRIVGKGAKQSPAEPAGHAMICATSPKAGARRRRRSSLSDSMR